MEGFPKREVYFKNVCSPVKASYPPTENLTEIPEVDWSVLRSRLTTSSTEKHLTLKITSAQVVETAVINNGSWQNLTHPCDHTVRFTDTHGLKPCIMLSYACLFVCLSTERSVVLHFRWTNQSCTLDMLIDKKSEGFENIEKRLANEVELFLLSLRLLGYLLFAIAYRVFSEWLYIKELKGALLHLTNYLQFMISRMSIKCFNCLACSLVPIVSDQIKVPTG